MNNFKIIKTDFTIRFNVQGGKENRQKKGGKNTIKKNERKS